MDTEKQDEKTTAVDVPQEQDSQQPKQQETPKQDTEDKSVDVQPTSDSDSEISAKIEALTKNQNSIIDMLTSILSAVSGDSKENDEPEKEDTAQKDDSVEDFENLVE